MSLYKEFSSLLPYLQSIRKIKNYLSFDITFPKTWKLPKRYVDESKIMEHQSTNENERLFSYVSDINESDVEKSCQNLKNIIKYNLEREEKEKLFDTKVQELKKVFEKLPLERLKGLYFDIEEQNQIKIEDNEEQLETNSLVAESNQQG
jgi:hypothetical protein